MSKVNKLNISSILLTMFTLVFLTNSVFALEVGLEPNRQYVEVLHKGQYVRVQRIQDQKHQLVGGFAKTSRKCPPFCIQPMVVAPGVTSVAEDFIFDFMEKSVNSGKGLLIDARIPAWHDKGTIPGSVNIPFTDIEKPVGSNELRQAFFKMGGVEREGVGSITLMIEEWGLNNGGQKTESWDFSNAKEVVLWCNGPWCGQSPRAIRALIKHGYPEEKIFYYRGGMQLWQIFGLVTIK